MRHVQSSHRLGILRPLRFGVLMAALLLVLAACSGGAMLKDSGSTGAKGKTVPPVMIQQVTGVPPAKLGDLKTALAVTGGERDIGIVEGDFQSGSFSLTGQFQATAENSGVHIVYQWQLRDSDGVLIQTIDGEDNAGLATGTDPWAAVNSGGIERIARRTTEAMAKKLAELGYATRVSSLTTPPSDYFASANRDAQREIDFETLNGPGMESAGLDLVAPPEDPAMTSASTDPLLNEAGVAEKAAAPIPEPQPAAETGSPTAVAESIDKPKAETKPKAKSGTQIRAVAVVPVKGSPGTGDAELTAAMRRTLSAAGWPVVTKRAPDALTIVGRVQVAEKGAANQSVSVRWEVQSPDGKSLGDVKQANDIPKGALDKGWGPAAVAVSEAAATGIFDIVKRYQ
jgi:hypothetical protein